MPKKIIPQIVLGAVVFNDNKVLILQRRKNEKVFPNLWELPSGKKEPLEAIKKSLIREVQEETGLDVEIVDILSAFGYQIEKEEEIIDSVQINFLVKPIKNAQVILSHEHQAYAWISRNEIDKYTISKNTQQAICKGFELINKLNK